MQPPQICLFAKAGTGVVTAAIAMTFAGCVGSQTNKTPAPEEGQVGVSLERPRPSRQRTLQKYFDAKPRIVYASFWDATANLDLEAADSLADDDAQRRFSAGLRFMLRGDIPAAEQLLDSLGSGSDHAFVATASRVLLTAALQYQDKWATLAKLPRDTTGDRLGDLNTAAVQVWAKAFSTVPPRAVFVPSLEQLMPLSVSRVGTPVIQVKVNGKTFSFWLDTGASMTILSSAVAKQSGIAPLVADTLSIATAAGRVAAVPALIQMLEIGEVKVGNATAMIVDEKLMEVRDSVSTRPADDIRIDGIIGWDTIRELDLTLDYHLRELQIRKPVKRVNAEDQATLFWIGVPIVRMRSGLGRSLHFALDTGAQESFATEWLLEKTFAQIVSVERTRVGGIGADRKYVARMIPRVAFVLPGQSLVLSRLLVYEPAFWTFVHLDGVLGSDIARAGIMRIDATNHFFALSRN